MLNAILMFILKGVTVTLAFGLLILVHEYGHFLVARWTGVRVLRFSFGFGPKILGWKRGETEYWFSAVPLGGYVKMAGEQYSERTNDPGEYLSKPAAVRALIVGAGPFVNWLLALVLLVGFFMAGLPGLLPIVGSVVDDMPAKAVGFQVGDQIKAIDGKRVDTWDEMTAVIHQSAGKKLNIAVQRGRSVTNFEVTPREEAVKTTTGEDLTVGLIGIGVGGAKLGPIEAVTTAWTLLNSWSVRTFEALGALFTGKRAFKDSVTGPLGIVYLTSEAVTMGAGPIIILLSIFSLSLAIFNCFPIPVLDGGHLLFIVLESLRGKPISMRIQERAAFVGLMLLLTLALFVSVNDLNRFWLNK